MTRLKARTPLPREILLKFYIQYSGIWQNTKFSPRVKVPCGAASRGPLRGKPRSHVAPRAEVPGDKIKPKHFGFWACVDPFRPKSAIPHLFTIKNMKFPEMNLFVKDPFHYPKQTET